MRRMNGREHVSKCRTSRKRERERRGEDVFHLDGDVTKDYLKGKDGGLLLEDRYGRRDGEEKKKRERSEYMFVLSRLLQSVK